MFRSFVSQSPDGFVLVNNSGEIDEWNHQMEIITGINREFAITKKIWEINTLILVDKTNQHSDLERIKSIYY